MLESFEPIGPLENRWNKHLFDLALVAPQNRDKHKIIVIGTGLAGASLCATLGEAGYNVSSFCFQDSPRRAHSIAAQGGINATKNYQNDGDSVWRLFYDTIKGGDFRARESNVYRLAELSGNIIDQAVAQGVPFAREYSGYLANRSFGGTQVSRTFYARGQTGQQLLLGAYSAMSRQVESGRVTHHSRTEMLEIITIDGKARGVVVRDLVSGELTTHTADCVVLCTGGYSNAYYLSTNAKGCNASATWRAFKQGAYFANPSFTQIHPTCIPPTGENQSKLTLMSESLRNDGRIWAPKNSEDCEKNPADIKEEDRDYFLERMYPAFANLVPRDVASRAVKLICDEGRGVGSRIHGQRLGVYLDFTDVINKTGLAEVEEKYGNLFEMYERITNEDPYTIPMKIYPAPHYSMGGLWVDYNLMTTLDGLFAAGEANFSDHGANRLGASALMQGLADGYFILPQTIANYLARNTFDNIDRHEQVQQALDAVKDRINKLMHAPNAQHSPEYFHQKLGKILWDACGMSREQARLVQAIDEIKALEIEFWKKIKVTGVDKDLNQTLERAGRVADFIELGILMCKDALNREESCGAHARVEHLSPSGEAKRNDEEFSFVAAWEYQQDKVKLHEEHLHFEFIKPTVRNYK
ncbi:MAG: fumarate reductase/succinate dehydrogenase flavoprotein subunit [Candidatus Thioglobus sp.]|jgi:succinate dehydrogenase / fumarate reductase flavoprotein subunit|nr:MAG: Succinate dehydrogenase/fumarate reductase, flavoprotein subunit [uncultured Candidatus Thioglobus sp.]MBT3431087.1 fumarate reductase/succinate dehydrogenase flavoprotein subunit [Candidatus Thioglobus sp.]MBT4553976.1 fumarate reductase/succinate dehydrogenase flavoprotein subunit [Candidatus Thioglobus sp.]MBT6327620.1 fumarate reductase/succinate dehydrogenase flavoprotein subunit [Candidatus Thioglobus sp.]MBT6655371.1 fumarate reductase/succinate dehydrogenase flavoprotein subunit